MKYLIRIHMQQKYERSRMESLFFKSWSGVEFLNLRVFGVDRGQVPPSLGPRLHLRKPSFWEAWASGWCLKQLEEEGQGRAGAGWSRAMGSLAAHGSFLSRTAPIPAVALCSRGHTHSPGKPLPD